MPVASPDRSPVASLDLRGRVVLGASVAVDLAVRTSLSSALCTAMLPWGLSSGPRRERERLRFYAEIARDKDAPATFPAPPGLAVQTAQSSPLPSTRNPGQIELLRFDSPFAAVNPALRESYAGARRNGVAWAQHWRHDDGPRPTLAVIHGFGASPFWFNSAFFALPKVYSAGYDVLLYTLPFHGARKSARQPLNGSELFAHGLAHFNEAMFHAVHDFRVFLDHLTAQGVEKVGLTGLSLGGYTTALLAAVESRLHLAIPTVPVTHVGSLMREWFPASMLMGAMARLSGVGEAEVDEGLAVHSPLNYRPLIPKDRTLIIGGLGDRMAPPSQSRLLWEHWDRPRLHWFPGSHTIHASRGVYLEEMRGFMESTGFAA